VQIERARLRLDGQVRSLAGQRLSGVAYFEIGYDGSSKPAWNRDPDFDSLDYGLELRFESGDVCWISWGNDFYTYALRIEINTHEDRGRMRVWEVSETSRWRSLVGQEITGAQIYWDWQQVGSHPRQWGPQDLELTFQGGAVVFISALEIAPGHDPFGHTNNVTVIFDEHVARRYPVGPFARTPHRTPGGASAGPS
jgi:hypothetical protein